MKRLEDSIAACQVQFDKVVACRDALEDSVKQLNAHLIKWKDQVDKDAKEIKELEDAVAWLAETAADRQSPTEPDRPGRPR